jgi:hypothetical protein
MKGVSAKQARMSKASASVNNSGESKRAIQRQRRAGTRAQRGEKAPGVVKKNTSVAEAQRL